MCLYPCRISEYRITDYRKAADAVVAMFELTTVIGLSWSAGPSTTAIRADSNRSVAFLA